MCSSDLITIEYYKGGDKVTNAVGVGTYTVKINVAESDNFQAATALTDASWTFTITAKSITGATVAAIADQTYTGSAITPATTVTLDGKTLVASTDYTVAWTANTNVTADQAKATGTITGTGNYTGEATAKAEFAIVPAPITSVTISSDTAAGEAVAAGDTLTANVSPDGAAATATYQWYNNGEAIADATSATYDVVDGDRKSVV